MTLDEQIIEAILQGNNSWVLQTLYKKTLPKVKKLIRKMGGAEDDALDVFQESVLILLRQVKLGKLNEGTEIDAYIHRVSRNFYLNDLRRKNKSVAFEDLDEMDRMIEPSIEGHLAMRQSEQQIMELLELLGQNCKELLKAIVLDEMDYQEVASKLGYSSADVVKTQKHRCKKKFEELLVQKPHLVHVLGKSGI